MLRSLGVVGLVGLGVAFAAAACASGDEPQTDPTTVATTGVAVGGQGGGGEGGSGGSGGNGGEPLGALGDPCEDTGDSCESGFCADGVCCDAACDGACEGCSSAGSCLAHEQGSDPDDECVAVTCDGAGACNYAEHQWSQMFGGDDDDVIHDIAINAQGQIAIAGSFEGTINIGSTQLTAKGRDGFVAKLDAQGTPLWIKHITDVASDTTAGQDAFGVAFVPDGRVVVVGGFSGNTDFGGTSGFVHQFGTDGFVALFTAGGNPVWLRFITRTNNTFTARPALAVAVDAARVVVGGRYRAQAVIEGTTLTPDAGNILGDTTYLAAYDLDGVLQWAKGGKDASADDGAVALALAENGDVAVCGYLESTIDLGGDTLTSAGGTDVYVAKLDANGTHIWSRRFGDPEEQSCGDVIIDADGVVHLVGTFTGSVNLGGGDMQAAVDSQDVFYGAFDGTGSNLVSLRFGDAYDDRAGGIALDTFGNVVITGDFAGGIDFGGGELSGELDGTLNDSDIFLAKLDPAGNHIYSRHYEGVDDDTAPVIAVGPNNRIALGAVSIGGIGFGSPPLDAIAAQDVAVALFNP